MPIGGLLTLTEAAEELGVDSSSLRHAIASGRLAVEGKAGKTYLIRPEEVERYGRERRNSGGRYPRKRADATGAVQADS